MTETNVLAGRYRLDRLLGEGAMGRVWLGYDLLLHRLVAVKQILSAAPDAGLVERALREARSAGSLHHPNVVAVHDLLVIDGLPLVVMEYVDGSTLAERMEDGPMDPLEVAAIGSGIAAGLAAAHRIGITHRDVKPANILVDKTDVSKLVDFGIARIEEQPGMTGTGTLIGTVAYMAPEAALGERVGPPADMWSLGATMFAAVEGRLVFEGTSTISILSQLITKPVLPPERPTPLNLLVYELLDRDPARRPTAAQAQRRLAQITQPILARSADTIISPNLLETLDSGTTPDLAVPQHRRRSRRPVAIVAAVAAVLAIATFAVVLIATGSDPQRPTAHGSARRSGTAPTSSGSSTPYKIGFVGAFSGAYAVLGINERQGAALAIEQANASGMYDFKITLDAQDSQGDPTQAKLPASTLIADPNVVAVMGPAFSGESEAVNPNFCGASPPMPTVTPSASRSTLQDHGWKCWHRIIPNDNVEGSQGADWLARTGAHKVFVLDDASPYGQGVAKTMVSELKTKGVTVETGSMPAATTKNYDPIANTIINSGSDAVFYGGFDVETALLAKSLKGAGFHGKEVTGNGSRSSTFTKNAGAAGDGWYFTCGCQDATKAPSAKQFAADYKKRWGEDPSTYSPEAFDAANLLIDAISKAESSGSVTRTSVLTALNGEDFTGITTQIKFQANGEVVPSNLIVNLFQQKSGQISGLGNIKELS